MTSSNERFLHPGLGLHALHLQSYVRAHSLCCQDGWLYCIGPSSWGKVPSSAQLFFCTPSSQVGLRLNICQLTMLTSVRPLLL